MAPTQILVYVHVHSWEHRNGRWLADGLNQIRGFWSVAQARALNEIKQKSGIIADGGNSCRKPFVIVPR